MRPKQWLRFKTTCNVSPRRTPARLATNEEPNNNTTQTIETAISVLNKAATTDSKAEAKTIVDDSNLVIVDPGITRTCPALFQVMLAIQYHNAISCNINNDNNNQAVVTTIQAVVITHITNVQGNNPNLADVAEQVPATPTPCPQHTE
jgi:hypothetical protein